jgi:2-methylcitrate dehydratase
MTCIEAPAYSRDYLDPEKRSIANAVQVFYQDGTSTPNTAVEYPIGHRRRRSRSHSLAVRQIPGKPSGRFNEEQIEKMIERFNQPKKLDETPVHEFVNLFIT